MKNKFYLIALFLVSIIFVGIFYSIRLKKMHATKEIRFKIFSELLRKVPKESCISSMDSFKNQLIFQHKFKEVYFIDVNGVYLGGKNANYIKDWTNLVEKVISWDGLGKMNIADERVAYWGRCSQKIIYIAIE
jgi:hypothetical protein